MTNGGLSTIHSLMKKVRMIPVCDLLLEDYWHDNFILFTN